MKKETQSEMSAILAVILVAAAVGALVAMAGAPGWAAGALFLVVLLFYKQRNP